MKELTKEKKIKLIEKYAKQYETILDLRLVNYDNNDFYVFLHHIKKSDVYRLSWFSLSIMNSDDIEDNLSCAYIPNKVIDLMYEDYLKCDVDLNYEEDLRGESEDIVYLKANIPTKKSSSINMSFQSFIPKKYDYIKRVISLVFSNMPLRYEFYYNELTKDINNFKTKYDYNKVLRFDLYKDNLNLLFKKQIINQGKKYYKDKRILFLENIDNRWYGIVNGNKKHVVMIKYDEKSKKMRVYCSCSSVSFCKHLYAVICSIRNKEYKNFYKIVFGAKESDLLTRISNFNFNLCLGVEKENFLIIGCEGEVVKVPILINGSYNWKIVEDDKNNSLNEKVKKIINNNK